MNKLIVFILVSSFFACDTICSLAPFVCKKDINKTYEVVDFTKIDEFPKFKNCSTLLNFEQNKACFEKTIHQKISNRIANLKLESKVYIKDTVMIKLSIDKNGYFLCNQIKINDTLDLMLPNINAEIQKIIHGLKAIQPAQKRGIPVKSNYTLPLVIETKNTN